MTDQAAYRRYTAEAEKALTQADRLESDEARVHVHSAQVWALLALAAAQERVQPADRPTDDNAEPVVIDREGDRWESTQGGYRCLAVPNLTLTREKLEKQYGPLSAPIT